MQRKQLLSLPTPPLMTAIVAEDTQVITCNPYGDYNYQKTIHNYIFTACTDDTTGETVLIIDTYRPSGEHQWRYFLNKSGQYFRWLTLEHKTSDAGMDYVLEYKHYNNYSCEKSTNAVICAFFGEKSIESPLNYIAKKNLTFKEKKHTDKLDKIRKSIDNAMLEIRELP